MLLLFFVCGGFLVFWGFEVGGGGGLVGVFLVLFIIILF